MGEREISHCRDLHPTSHVQLVRLHGKELYYIAPDGTLMAASITMKEAALESGTPVALFHPRIWGGETEATQGQQYDVAPDGRFLINIASEDASAAPITLLLNWKPKP